MKIFGTDYDGVIINIEPKKALAFGELLNIHWGVNTEEASDFWLATQGTSRRYKFDHYYEKVFQDKLSEKAYKKIESEFSHVLKNQCYPQVQLLPGAEKLLQYAQNHFELLFVSSGISMDEIKYLVNLNGLSNYFNLILGTDNQYPSKREHFQKIILDHHPDNIVFVADGPEDMRIAKEFTCVTSVGVTSNHTEKELSAVGADHVVSNLPQVHSLLRKLHKI